MLLKTAIAALISFLLILVIAGRTGHFERSLSARNTGAPKTSRNLSASGPQVDWDPKAAARYLDQREAWWMEWQVASRDHGTFCVSCHTTLPYMLARPVLRGSLNETESTLIENKTLENVRKRVLLWQTVEPYYSSAENGPHMSEDSRATEAVVNALLLAAEDSRHGALTKETRMALGNMWALQITTGEQKGAWPWQKFGLQPWESNDSAYFGASLAALAVGIAPDGYATKPEIQQNVQLLRDHLNRRLSEQPLLNRLVVLWAASRLPGLLKTQDQQAIVEDILDKQQRDGGWRLSSLLWTWRNGGLSSLRSMWRKADWSYQESQSDGLATGMVCYILQDWGLPRDNPKLAAGLVSLRRTQDKTEGLWIAYSLNKRRDPTSNVGRFMTDAATGFAVLALTDGSAGVNR
jgi:squalene-hopene/tetraprenyl-beta-curcumene cyclase